MRPMILNLNQNLRYNLTIVGEMFNERSILAIIIV